MSSELLSQPELKLCDLEATLLVSALPLMSVLLFWSSWHNLLGLKTRTVLAFTLLPWQMLRRQRICSAAVCEPL